MAQLTKNHKPLLLALNCLQIVDGCDDAMGLWKLQQSRKALPERFPEPCDLNIWLGFYRNHRLVMNVLGAMALDTSQLAQVLPTSKDFGQQSAAKTTDVLDEYRRFGSMSPAEQVAAIQNMTPQQQVGLQLWGKSIAWLPAEPWVQELLKLQANQPEDTDDATMTIPPELIFLATVWLPCLVLYRTHPGQLLHRARSGDTDALDDLLRLDKSVLGDTKIADHWHQAMRGKSRGMANRLLRAVTGSPRNKLTGKRLREAMAGFMKQTALGFGTTLTEPEIRGLFDAVSKVKHQRIDTQLPTSPEALSKAIQRHGEWPPLNK